MMKRIALFLDGTWNTVEDNTNVCALRNLVAARDGAIRQHVYYDEGVGTKRFQWLRGGALGYGLDDNIVEAYQELVDQYDDGDEIYIFGFSRGAFTARSLAGFVAKCGLLRKGAALDAETLFDRYQLAASVRPIYTLEWLVSQGEPISAEEQRLLAASRRVPIKMIAVWDTVGALGVPFGDIPGISRRKFQFHHSRLSKLYEHAYHALAIDEHRAAFEPTLWTRFIPKLPDPEPDPVLSEREPKVEQRWFVGAHSDVGGGSPSRLPQHALAWFQAKAEAAGLKMTGRAPIDPAAIGDPIFDSFSAFMGGLYKIVRRGRRFTRTIQADRIDKKTGWVETVAETIDASVFDRYRRDPAYRPPGLLAWAAKRGLDPAAIHHDTDAHTGAPL